MKQLCAHMCLSEWAGTIHQPLDSAQDPVSIVILS